MTSLDQFILSPAFEVSVLGVFFLLSLVGWWRADVAHWRRLRKNHFNTFRGGKSLPRSKLLPS